MKRKCPTCEGEKYKERKGNDGSIFECLTCGAVWYESKAK